jgi:hypothetical protein
MKNHTIILAVLIVVVSAAGLVALNKFQDTPKTKPYEQVRTERDNALKALYIHDQINKVKLDTANNQVTDLTGKVTTLCSQIKAAKLVQPLCK